MRVPRFRLLPIFPALAFFGCTFFSCAAALAQRGGPSSGATTTTRPTAPSTNQPQLPGQQQQQQEQQGQTTRPIFISGQVVTSDGTPPPRNVEIYRNCGSTNRREAYADLTGHFGFEIGGGQPDVMQDASTRGSFDPRNPGSTGDSGLPDMASANIGNSGVPNLFGCELRAQAAGFTSTSIELSSFRGDETIDVGSIVLERLEKVPGTMISATTAAAPGAAQKAFKKGLDAEKKDKTAEAQQRFEEATQIYPRFAQAWTELGSLLQRENQTDGAEKAYRQAIVADPKFVTPYFGLAGLATQQRNWDDSARLSKQVIALDPIDFPGDYLINAVANFNLGHLDLAESSARKAYTLDSGHRLPQIQAVLARILLAKKDYPGATENFNAYLRRSPDAADAAEIRRELDTLQQASAAPGSPATSASSKR